MSGVIRSDIATLSFLRSFYKFDIMKMKEQVSDKLCDENETERLTKRIELAKTNLKEVEEELENLQKESNNE